MGKAVVTRNEAMRIHDLLCDAAWLTMGEEVLGTSRRPVRDAYETLLVDTTLPLFWLEMPLAGTPHVDLHVSYDYYELCPDVRFAQGHGLGYQGLIDWFAGHGCPGSGIDFSVDLTETGVGVVGAYVIFNNREDMDLEGFCASVDCGGFEAHCRSIAESFAPGWKVWCVNPFPGRPGETVRAAALATKALLSHLAGNPSAVRESLAGMGLAAVSDELCERVSKLATLPLELELRIGLDGDGALSDRFAVSFYLSRRHLAAAGRARLFGEGGAGWQVLSWFEEWGIADDRWRAVAQGGFSRLAPFTRDDGTRCQVALVCSPTCYMMPWEKGEPLASKAYSKLEGYLVV